MINPMNTSKERVLLVESDPEISDLISRQTLKPMGYVVEVVAAAPTAMQEASRFAPDVIIANLNLPGLSGKDLLVALNSQGLEVPIIVIAPRGMESDIIQAFRLGATDFLYWPIREAEVVSAVERVLRQVRARREREVLARQLNHTNQELQRRVRELTTIFAIGKAVITAADQQSLFNKIMEGATFVSEADSGWFVVREDRNKAFFLRACRNVPNEITSRMNQPWDDGLSSLVALSGESLSIDGEPLKRFKVSNLGESALVVPVKAKKEVMGLLVVVRKAKQPFNASQQALVEAVADYASISLVNTRLFKALEERVNVLQSAASTAVFDEQIGTEVLEQSVEELQSPLKVIGENIRRLLKDGDKLSPEQNKALETVQEKLTSIGGIVDLMQSMSSAKNKSKASRTNLNNTISSAVKRMQPIARQAGVNLSAELPPKPLIVLADEDQICKVLEGLLSNAIKYSLQGGRVIVHTDTTGEKTARVAVQDRGIGIDPKYLPAIFKPTTRDSAVAPERFGGVGISLPLISEIIAKHGGKLWAESKPGQGSVFYFTLQLISEV
jgi:signal transduction histidine kinase/DNA-binding response OmpR family regulator